jgi:molybdate transport system regulatory protein
VLTLCKATSVIVRRDMPDSGNVARGIVVRSARTRHMAEVSVQLSGGVTLVGFAAEGAHLKVGETVYVQFDESSVVIAVFD